MRTRLTLGPVPFHWGAPKWRDFYFRIADEGAVDTVYLGEVVCGKRSSFYVDIYDEVVARLVRAGKEVVDSTLALIMAESDRNLVRAAIAAAGSRWVEVNDVGTVALLQGKPHVIGPFIGVYNEGTANEFVAHGAQRICVPAELPGPSVARLAEAVGPHLEVSVFGRQPLALSARCYHARARGLTKSACQFVCGEDPDGLEVETLDRTPFVAVDGPVVLSHAFLCLLDELAELVAAGIRWFRLMPHDTDMTAVIARYREVLDGATAPGAAIEALRRLGIGAPLANGAYHGGAGETWLASGAPGA